MSPGPAIHGRCGAPEALPAGKYKAPPPRRVRWFSAGAASAVATQLDLKEHGGGVIAYCETGSEDADNARFLKDCEEWFGRVVYPIGSPDYASTWEVWEDRRYMSGIAGAPCTSELKIGPRLAFQRPDDIHVFGYTADSNDVRRFEAFKANYPDTTAVAPLIERGITKAGCLAIVQGAGIALPRVYAMGFQNANCIPCVKATSPDYWALVRLRFPEQFERAAKLSRELGVRLAILSREIDADGKVRNVRGFIDEIPADQPVTNPIAPACDFLCHIGGMDAAA